MDNSLSKIVGTASDAIEKAGEIVQERLFSPMYFYFFIAWIVSNWKFAYVLLFVDEKTILVTQRMLKVDYLAQMYGLDWSGILHLVIAPLISSFVFVWWLSLLSTKFYRKHEENQMEKRSAKRAVEYAEKVEIAKSEGEIRKAIFDTRVKYEDQKRFNDSMDENFDKVNIAGTSLLPSEVLYNTDYEAYKEALEEFQNEVTESDESPF